MIKVTAPKDRRVHLATTGGMAVNLAAGETRRLQGAFMQVAAENGCAVVPDDDESNVASIDGKTREERIDKAVRSVMEDSNSTEITGQGTPRVSAIKGRSGLNDVTADEIQAVLDADAG